MQSLTQDKNNYLSDKISPMQVGGKIGEIFLLAKTSMHNYEFCYHNVIIILTL